MPGALFAGKIYLLLASLLKAPLTDHPHQSIQNFGESLSDDQLNHLARVLQLPSCKIWAINIGEAGKIDDKTWVRFAESLKNTNVTHMYASEHQLRDGRKDQMEKIVLANQDSSSHKLHCKPSNNAVIKEVTHM